MISDKKQLFTKRFFPAGTYTWTVPRGCTEVDVFLVGGGGAGNSGSGGGGGYTKTYKAAATGYRDGAAITVTSGQSISIIVGAGGKRPSGEMVAPNGGYSQFLSSLYRANGGNGAGNGYVSGPAPGGYTGGNGGSGGASDNSIKGHPGSDGGNGNYGSNGESPGSNFAGGRGQGHTTRDWGESNGARNAGGGAADRGSQLTGGTSDYSLGSGDGAAGGGGYGGGGGGIGVSPGNGGDGTVLIRYYAYEE